MDQVAEYFEIMARGSSFKTDQGMEKHHIIPKSIFGDPVVQKMLNRFGASSENDKCNQVCLKTEDHYKAHEILAALFKGKSTNAHNRMLYAFHFMSSRAGGSETYGAFRKEHAKLVSDSLKGKPSRAKGTKWSPEAKEKLAQLTKGRSYEERYGAAKAAELRELRSKKLKELREAGGREWNEKISKAKSGVPLSEKNRNSKAAFFGDTRKNPNVNQTLYLFHNRVTGETVTARMVDMKHRGCPSVSALVRGKEKTSGGWVFLGPADGCRRCPAYPEINE